MSDAPQQPPTLPDAPRTPKKKDVAITLLEGPSLFVHLDPRKPGVVVPQRFMEQPQLMLQVGLNMAIAIPDLKVDDEGLTCTLSFNQRPFWCSIPWSAVYALVGEDSRGMLWPDDVPPELASQMQAQQRSGPKAVAPKKPRPKLAAVEPEPEEASPRKKEPRRTLSAVPPARGARAPSGGGLRSRSGSGVSSDGAMGRSGVTEREGADVTSERDRPTLSAVPSAAPSGPGARPSPMPSPPILRSEEEGEDRPSKPSPARPSFGGPGKKPKRELPPYLRVIK